MLRVRVPSPALVRWPRFAGGRPAGVDTIATPQQDKRRLTALYSLGPDNYEKIYGPAERADLASMLDVRDGVASREDVAANPELLQGVEVIISGWGCPRLEGALLEHADALKLVLYGAGSIKGVMTEAAWDRSIRITSAAAANALPVAEYTLGSILMALKGAYVLQRRTHKEHRRARDPRFPGGYEATVGIVSLGLIGCRVCELLQPFDHTILAYDIAEDAALADRFGLNYTGLDDLFQRSDVVSIHTPWLPETEGMITGPMIRSMKPNATLINTARGAVIDEPAMVAALQDRPDVTAILDVTHPEPPADDSPLWTMENVFMTPHIAGAMGHECRRMGRYMVDELRRYLAGEPMLHEVTREAARLMA